MKKTNNAEPYEFTFDFDPYVLAPCLAHFYKYRAEKNEYFYQMKREIIASLLEYLDSLKSAPHDNPPHYSFTQNDANFCYASIVFLLAQYDRNELDDQMRQFVDENNSELHHLKDTMAHLLSVYEDRPVS